MNQDETLSPQSDDLGYGQLFAIFWRRRYWFITVFFGVMSVAVPLALLKATIYRSSMELLVEPNYQARKGGIENEFTDTNVQVDYATQLQLMKSSGLIQKAVNQLSSVYPNLTVREITRSLQLSQLGSDQAPTKIFQLSYEGEDPRKIRDILQAMQSVYVDYNLEQQEERLNQGLSFINQQLPKTREELASAEKEVEEFRKTHDLITPDQQASSLVGALQSLDRNQEQVQTQIREAQARYGELQQQVGKSADQAVISARLSESGRYQSLLNQLQEAEVALAKEKTRFTEQNPVIQNLIEQRDNLRQLLREEAEQILGTIPESLDPSETALEKEGQFGGIDLGLAQSLVQTQTELEALRARQRSLAQTEAELRENLEKFPSLIAEYNRLQQEVEVKRNSLEQLLVARQELGVELARGGFKWQVVEPPRLGYPVGPNTKQDLLLGVVVATFLGGLVTFIWEALDNAVRSSEEIQEQSLTLLGITPKLPDPDQGQFKVNLPWAVERDAPILDLLRWRPFRESLDLIYKNIELVSSETGIQSLGVTSALTGEGKSTLAIGLAFSATRLNRRVLLVDADLRQPNLHEQFDLPNESGLATFLAGETKPVAHRVELMGSAIDVLTAGPPPSDPVQLLSSWRLQDLKNAFADYDLIVFDTPPVLGIVDTMQIASSCSHTVLVARLNYVTQSELNQACHQLSKLNVVGIVANGAKETGNPYLSMNEQNSYLSSAEPSTP